MPLVLVLIGWCIVGAILAVLCGTVLGIVLLIVTPKKYGTLRIKRAAAVFLMSVLLVPYFLVTFIMYALWCQGIRKVDPGLGDFWQAHINDKYDICMIDVPEQAYISHGDRNVFSGFVELIGESPRIIYGKLSYGDKPYFAIDNSDDSVMYYKDENSLACELKRRGITDYRLLTSYDMYVSKRYGIADTIAFVVVMGLPVLFYTAVWILFFRSRKLRHPG